MPPRGCITTFTGRSVNLLQPSPDMFCIEDIAHHLSQVCRWAGATKHFYSVAQHCVLVSKIAPPELRRWALLHDAAEAYIGDMTRPLKALMDEFRVIEDRIMEQIAIQFQLSWPEPTELAQYDDQIQKIESERFVNHDGMLHDRSGAVAILPDLRPSTLTEYLLVPMNPQTAETAFLWRYRRLFLDDDGL